MRRRRGRAARLDPAAAALPGALTADAMDEAACARELIDDLLVLVEAGHVRPLDGNREIGYAATTDRVGAQRGPLGGTP